MSRRARSPRWTAGCAGERYLLIGRPEDTFSTAAGINRACEIAGIDHRVEDLDYRFGSRSVDGRIRAYLDGHRGGRGQERAQAQNDDNLTTRRLGYRPMSFDDGLRLLISWLRELGKL